MWINKYSKSINIKSTLIVIFFFVISYILVAPFLLQPDVIITHDYRIHLTMIAQFAQALQSGDFPIRWASGVTYYGSAVPLVSHQLTAYLGAFIYFTTNNIIFSGNMLFFIGAFFSNVFYYLFLRKHFSLFPSLIGVIFMNFSSYRIFNIYTRGALPEFFSTIFVPLVFIGIYQINVQKNALRGFVLTWIATLLLSLNHPMMLVIYGPLILGYMIYAYIHGKSLQHFFVTCLAMFIGVGSASYYLVPLLTEIKYFYYGAGSTTSYFNFNQFVSLKNYVIHQTLSPKDLQMNFDAQMQKMIYFGFIETLFFFSASGLLLYKHFKKNSFNHKSILATLMIIFGVFYILLTLPLSKIIYQYAPLLPSIQFPWRMWSALFIITSIIITYLIDCWGRKLISLIIVVWFLVITLPQIQTNGFIKVSQADFFTTSKNVYTVVMQTVWSGPPENYTMHDTQSEILNGEGRIITNNVKNSSRNYSIVAEEQLRVIDHTTYFPGWSVYIDGQKTDIQFQDPSYRGTITFEVPKGGHEVEVIFENTKVRLIANILSIMFISIAFISITLIHSNYGKIILKRIQAIYSSTTTLFNK